MEKQIKMSTYEKPSVEIIGIEIESALLSSSGGDVVDNSYTAPEYNIWEDSL